LENATGYHCSRHENTPPSPAGCGKDRATGDGTDVVITIEVTAGRSTAAAITLHWRGEITVKETCELYIGVGAAGVGAAADGPEGSSMVACCCVVMIVMMSFPTSILL